jgi:uncharacterized protein YbcI
MYKSLEHIIREIKEGKNIREKKKDSLEGAIRKVQCTLFVKATSDLRRRSGEAIMLFSLPNKVRNNTKLLLSSILRVMLSKGKGKGKGEG